MKHSLQYGILIVVLALVIGIGYLVSKHPSMIPESAIASSDAVQVGVILPLTGDSATSGSATKNALELALHEINRQEKWANKPLELMYEDGKCTFEGGKQAAKQLIRRGVTVIIGGFCSGETLGAGSVTQDAGVLLVTPSSSSPHISDLGDMVFRVAASDTLSGEVLAEKVHSEQHGTIAVIHEETDYAVALSERFQEVYGGLGGTIRILESFPLDTREFGEYTRLITNDVTLDAVVVITQSAVTMRRILQDLIAQRVAIPYFANEFADSNEVLTLGDAVAGVSYAVPFLDETNPATQALRAMYEREYGIFSSLPFFYIATAYDTMHIVADAMTPNDLNPEKIAEHLSTLRGYSGASHKALFFDENGDANQEFVIRELGGL